jgi:hypothetical protein
MHAPLIHRACTTFSRVEQVLAGLAVDEMELQVGFQVLEAPRSWAEQAYPNLIYFNEVDRGGHFAAWEEPQLFSEETRAAFKSLR